MSRAAALIVGGLVVGGGVLLVQSRKAGAAEGGRFPGETSDGDVSPFLFDVLPNGVVVFKPAVAAGLLPMLGQRGFNHPEAGNFNLISLQGQALPGAQTAQSWAIERNATKTILAVRHLSVPTAPPPNGPFVLMMAVTPGQEVQLAQEDSLWAVYALVGTLQQGAGLQPADPLLPPLPTIPSVLGDDEIPPPGVLDPTVPPLPGPVFPPQQPGMPPALKAQFDQIMANPNATPAQLRAAAQVMRAAGFEAEAQALEAKAAAIEAQQGLANAVPRMIQIPASGAVTPGHVAIHYTGDIKRFKELAAPTNPQIKVVGSGNNQGLSPWVGQTIALPGNWPQKPTPPKGTVEVSGPNVPGSGQGEFPQFPTVPGGGQGTFDPFGPSAEVLGDAFNNLPFFV